MSRAQETLSPRTGLWLTLLTLVSIPLWLWGMRWLQEDFSGWSALAEHYPVRTHELTGSVGPVVVAIQHGNGVRHEFNNCRTRQCPIIEVGLNPQGFWLRSTQQSPTPPLFVPWHAVERCTQLSAHLQVTQPDKPPVRIIIQHPDFERACTAATWRR